MKSVQNVHFDGNVRSIIFLDRNPWNRKEPKMVDISRIFGFSFATVIRGWVHTFAMPAVE